MTTIKLESRLSGRGTLYVTGLSTAAYLVALGHVPQTVTTGRAGRTCAIFHRTAEVEADARRYQTTIDTLVAQAGGSAAYPTEGART